jgi:hypothetical protein
MCRRRVIALTIPQDVPTQLLCDPDFQGDAIPPRKSAPAAQKLLDGNSAMIGQTSRRVGPLLLIAFIGACSPQSVPPPDESYSRSPAGGGLDGAPGGGADAAPGGGIVDATTLDASGGDGGLVSDGSAPHSSPFQGFDVMVAPIVVTDASYDPVAHDGGMRGGGNSTVCYQELAWWMTGAMLDPTVVASSAAAQLNPLLSAQHPLTLADYVDSAGQYWLQISGTETNGVEQQYFPYQYAVAPAALAITAGEYPTLTATPPSSQPSGGFIRLLDSSQAEVWIPITQIAASATAGDPLCQSLANGSLTAIVPVSAASTSLAINGATTTLAQVLGPTTATAPVGWSIGIIFTATVVQGTFK